MLGPVFIEFSWADGGRWVGGSAGGLQHLPLCRSQPGTGLGVRIVRAHR